MQRHNRRCQLALGFVRHTLALYCVLLLSTASALGATKGSHLHVSVWYWLNSVPKTKWQTDFRAIKKLGCTDVVLVWGFDGAAFAARVRDSHEAIRSAHKAGLGSYLFVWHARYSSLPHASQDSQVDAAGHTLFAFDAFNPQWRMHQWKTYLHGIAKTYRHDKGLRGYVFDNSFAIGYLGKVDGAPPRQQDAYISYGPAERRAFARPLPTSPSDPEWSAWAAVRSQWWAAWAKDTRDALRAIDANPAHQLVLEDGQNTLDRDTEERTGLDLGKVARYFDAMCAYWAPTYSDGTPDEKLAADVQTYLSRMRAAIGPDTRLSLSLCLSDDSSESTPGQAAKPTLRQIRTIISAALSKDIDRIDLYGYRMGVFHLQSPEWEQYLPGTAPTYPVTGELQGKFIADRPDIWPGLSEYLATLAAAQQNR